MTHEIRQTGRYEANESQLGISNAGGRAVLLRQLVQVPRAKASILTIDVVNEEVASALGTARSVGVANEAEAHLQDVPLIVEDILGQARRLADSGAPTEAVKALLDHVADLREGRR